MKLLQSIINFCEKVERTCDAIDSVLPAENTQAQNDECITYAMTDEAGTENGHFARPTKFVNGEPRLFE